MNESTALIVVVTISLVLSTATVTAIHAPLRRLLEAICPLGFTAVFWTRAAVLVAAAGECATGGERLSAAGALNHQTLTFLNCQGSVLSRSSGNSRSRSCSGVQSV